MEQNNLNQEQLNSISLKSNEPINNPQFQPEEEEKGITLSQIWRMIVKHWVALIICILVGFAGGFGYAKFVKKPSYQSSVQMMIVNSGSTTTTAENEISLAIRKTQIAYGYLTTDEVATSVGKKLGEKKYDIYLKDDNGNATENIDVSAVKKLYSVSIPTVVSNTTSIYLTITSNCNNKNMAIDVVNYVATSAIELVNSTSSSVYGYLNNSLTCIGTANSAKDTSTSTAVLSIIGAVIGLVVGAAYGIIRELTNTHVSSKQELETLSGYKVIGMIPKAELNEDEKEGESENAK